MIQPWFNDAKLGIFIHYGIYSVNGIAESWYFRFDYSKKYKPYMQQLDGFTASKFDAEEWAKLFKKSGAKYAVLTSKHHDGVALFDTKHSDLSVVKRSPAKRDLIAPYCEALRNNGLRVGIYFTQCDWSAPDYTAKNWHPFKYFIDTFFLHKKHWNEFKKFHRAQLTEILKNYGKIDLLWFDGDWERSQKDWDMKGLKEWLTKISPETVINSRIGSYGDYETPEQQIPTIRPTRPWEYCMTINDSWGYQPKDKHFKSAEQIIRIFSETISMGGNLLLDIGPREDGSIQEEFVEILEKLGEFTSANEEAIWNTNAVKSDIFSGGITVSRDKNKIFFFQYGIPNEKIPVYISPKNIKNVTLLNREKPLEFTADDDMIWVELSDNDFIYQTAVFSIELTTNVKEVI